MRIGDIVLVNTTPPHIASVTADNQVICEDGSTMPVDPSSMSILADALSVIKELERSVLEYGSTWRLCDNP